MKKITLLVFLILLIGTVQTLLAQNGNCQTHAWISDKDPAGLNVRDKPNINGKVLTKLIGRDAEDILMLTIFGYENGWAKIKSVSSFDGEDVFADPGWVSAKMVVVGTKGVPNYDAPAPLYEKPSKSNRKIGSIPSETTVHMIGFDCFGLKVTYKNKTGWLSFDNICGNPETTCV